MGNFNLKENIPHICTPLTGQTVVELLEQLDNIIGKKPDMIEWRADFFELLHDFEAVVDFIEQVKEKTEIPLLFTIRSIHEGGEDIELTEVDKVALICHVCAQTAVEFVDYETSNEREYLEQIREAAVKHGKELILSYHNFMKTPDNDELLERALLAERVGADVVKLAVMPESKEDVFRLLNVTQELARKLDCPIITMSMGELGAMSRVNGWLYGSCLTFAVGVEVSAPGQIAIEPLREAIEQTKSLLPAW
ncbi:MAG TPA: type I 3-dehydroquinate dehydratase [Pseudogracilibacillus sp.]|nr:type I 3-dehydroquinate dehydratase [Pseudogracilibacillus sp.]